MRATLIEIDLNLPAHAWYVHLTGLRFWCVRDPNDHDVWQVLPGQGVEACSNKAILAEHAWTVREAEVELVLQEVASEGGQQALDLVGEAS